MDMCAYVWQCERKADASVRHDAFICVTDTCVRVCGSASGMLMHMCGMMQSYL